MPLEPNSMDEQSIFSAALELEDVAARQAFLDTTCASDPALRKRVERLLKVHPEAETFMTEPAAPGFVLTTDRLFTEQLGTQIGPYKLIEQIGDGGMGLVFHAQQQEPVCREVALKIIKPGMDTREVLSRFEAEKQALAMMDHPNIARVLDGGATESSRPYFVMELVPGVPITEYCDQHQLTVRHRLDLFITVCNAVQHAHQKGIIHRDIKPSNILVTRAEGPPVPKIIDFGVAKATNRQLTDGTAFTGHGLLLGTPLYMSPEQAEMGSADVDTRSDIYSLGVLLYELLTGGTPLDRQWPPEAGVEGFRKSVRETVPPRPSVRVSTLGETGRDRGSESTYGASETQPSPAAASWTGL